MTGICSRITLAATLLAVMTTGSGCTRAAQPMAATPDAPRVPQHTVATPGAPRGPQHMVATPGAPHSLIVHPTDVALDTQGNVYVALRDSNRIVKLSPTGRLLAVWGQKSSDAPQSKKGIAVDGRGNVYVAGATTRADGNGLAKLSPRGRRLAYFGTQGTGPGQFREPHDVAVDAQGNLYVADTDNNRVQKLSPTGTPLAQWNGRAGSDPGFSHPTGIALDRQGNIYVADHRLGRVVKLSPRGKPLAHWSLPGNQTEDIDDVAVDSRGNVYTTGEGHNQKTGIVKRNPAGAVLAFWSRFPEVSNLAVDARGAMYGVDHDGTGVLKISPAGKVLAVWR